MFHSNTLKNFGSVVVLTAIIVACSGLPGRAAVTRSHAAAQSELFTKCWEYKSSPDLTKSAASNDASFYFLNSDNRLEAVDLNTAAKRWSTELGGEVISNLFASDSSVFVVTISPPLGNAIERKLLLRSLSKQTGITNWSTDVPYSPRVFLGNLNGNIISVGSGGVIAAYSSSDGAQIWNKHLGSRVTTEPYFTAGELAIGTDKKEVITVAGTNGKTAVVSTLQHLPSAVLIGPEKRYLIGDERGNLVSGTARSRRWKFKNGARISFVLSYGSGFLASSFDNFIYKLSRGGNVEWKRRLSGRVANRPLIINDTAIVSIVGDGTVYIIDLKNGKIVSRIETGDENAPGIAATTRQGEFVVSTSTGLSFYTQAKCPGK